MRIPLVCLSCGLHCSKARKCCENPRPAYYLIKEMVNRKVRWMLQDSEDTTLTLIHQMQASTGPQRSNLLEALAFLNKVNGETIANSFGPVPIFEKGNRKEIFDSYNANQRCALNNGCDMLQISSTLSNTFESSLIDAIDALGGQKNNAGTRV